MEENSVQGGIRILLDFDHRSSPTELQGQNRSWPWMLEILCHVIVIEGYVIYVGRLALMLE